MPPYSCGMPDQLPTRRPFDLDAYVHRSRTGPCFVCAILEGHPDYRHDDVYEGPDIIAFLALYPTLLGHCIIAPKQHVEDWVHDLSEDQFSRLQVVVQRVARAVAATLPTERMYSFSLGSRQGNAHLHWHVTPLPPGVPYAEQQFKALMSESGVLDVSPESQTDLAARIRSRLLSSTD
jgi:diadenosine tetraphosphate (Ap4A) HIT family hydrolase